MVTTVAAMETGSVAIAEEPSDRRTNTGVQTGASTVSDPLLSVIGTTSFVAIVTLWVPVSLTPVPIEIACQFI